MKFTVTEEEAREMARFEAEVGCDISAGADWGMHLDSLLERALNHVDQVKLIEFLFEHLGQVLSQPELEELVTGFQAQVQKKIAEKVTTRNSA